MIKRVDIALPHPHTLYTRAGPMAAVHTHYTQGQDLCMAAVHTVTLTQTSWDTCALIRHTRARTRVRVQAVTGLALAGGLHMPHG